MLNSLLNTKYDQNDVLSMLEGHYLFLQKNTGLTNDATQDHYVFNPESVLSNNRHYIAGTQMEAQPNGDATTEGQALQIIGYCYAYMAVGKKEYLDEAIKCFDAYIEHFYGGQPIPDSPKRYVCNWILNGKEPVLSNWPVDFDVPTHSGFKGEVMNYTNGRCLIPHGAPYWGEYLDKATFAFDGALGWDSIVADVYGLKPDGVTTDWNSKGQQYDVDWLINYQGNKIDWDGNRLSEGHPESEYGTIQLKNTSINGPHKTNWGNAQPVEHGGYLIQRNETWHNRPLRVPVGTIKEGTRQYGQFGNASDAEQWFADAAYLLYRITNEPQYWTVWKCVIETCKEYADIGMKDKFFRQEVGAVTPFTDGISYDYSYPDGTIIQFIRDAQGNIGVTSVEASQHTMEQQAVWFTVDQNSKVRTTVAGIANDGTKLNFNVTIKVSDNRDAPESSWTTWGTTLPYSNGLVPQIRDVPMSNFTQVKRADGGEFILADGRTMADYGNASWEMLYENNILDGRSAMIAKSRILDSSGGILIGFWLTDAGKAPVDSIVIRTNNPIRAEITDDSGWFWYWTIPDTGGAWQQVSLGKGGLTLGAYQVNPGTRPTVPNYSVVKQVGFNMMPSSTPVEFSWYCVNTIPARYNLGKKVIMLYQLTTRGTSGYNYYLGDCDVQDFIPDDLFCTPGTIPFSNIYADGSQQFDGWHGMPYPGYQYPFIWLKDAAYKPQLNNMIKFMYESQKWYTGKFGITGPGASAYIWNRWDNYKYGPADTWTMYHWGDGHAWAGYQPRAYFGAARTWYELVIDGQPVPDQLVAYTENWIRYLTDFMTNSGGVSPTEFPMESIPVPDPTDFTGHMCGLWLAGSCMAALSGSTVPGLQNLIEMLVSELNRNYKITPTPEHVMNGSWSPALRLDTGSGPENNGMFFGFWSGEILRGLGLYLLYKRMNPKENMYELKEE